MSLYQLRNRLKFAWAYITHKDSNLISHSNKELAFLFKSGDNLDAEMAKGLIEMVRVFEMQHHSGSSAAFTMPMLNDLVRFKPLQPLTGEDDEWMHVHEDVYQNKRCSNIFKDKTGAYDIDGIIWRDGVSGYTNNYSKTPVSFPHTPKDPIYITVGYNPTEQQYQALREEALRTQ